MVLGWKFTFVFVQLIFTSSNYGKLFSTPLSHSNMYTLYVPRFSIKETWHFAHKAYV